MTYDVRDIANYILDVADKLHVPLTNIAINKLIYFLHAHFVVESNKPLITAKIEAWEHGPVFREIYREFRIHKDKPISTRARKIDLNTGLGTIDAPDIALSDRNLIDQILPRYIRLSAAALVALSHEKDGPWDRTWNYDTLSNPTMRISDDSIRSWFNSAARH
ncbi:Panacea domain-containing protein [Phreatobacter stygius]|uniref:DUF4065 domain-containing protein n=1 Tax=Phreatobacter stygius TaxID=1940610 RepID=A0A4D7B537_9HYPH|nr:type II toxin-antitoxin system antitoxin SocA domain-containing protein [Phreatobacter stygius]QCI65200.1 DUF4065 domain-containing protein [Phreatobacter stygius]